MTERYKDLAFGSSGKILLGRYLSPVIEMGRRPGDKMAFDSPRAIIAARLGILGLNLSGASKAIGANASYLQQYMQRGIPAVLPEDKREKLAGLLNINPDELRGTTPSKGGPKPIAPDSVAVTEDEAALLRLFRSAAPEVRPFILKAAKSFQSNETD
jgi:hypothetical protein